MADIKCCPNCRADITFLGRRYKCIWHCRKCAYQWDSNETPPDCILSGVWHNDSALLRGPFLGTSIVRLFRRAWAWCWGWSGDKPIVTKARWYPKLGIKTERTLTENDAERIRELKRGCTYRRLAELWHPDPSHDLHGNQLEGEDLCREACAILGIDWMNPPQFPSTPEFDQVNKSHYGDFYWWE